MFKLPNQSRFASILSISLPDDRPITGLQVVENLDRCPKGFTAISRTYDQDQDADLWRETSILKRKTERYLCLSKSHGLPGHVIEEICITTDKIPPVGYSLINRTSDTEQKAWRKKQLCYKLVPRKSARLVVTDIIVCSRLKKAPEGFTFAGEINGVIICYKMGNTQDGQAPPQDESKRPELPPKSSSQLPPKSSQVPPYPSQPTAYPNLAEDGDYEILNPDFNNRPPPIVRPAPSRPAPLVPANSTHTLLPQQQSALQGVPFILNPKYGNSSRSEKAQYPVIKARTMQQLMKDYDYSFSVERQ